MTQPDETRDRFLAAVAERLTPDTIAEAHVFTPIRQGGIESGVAVIAVHHGSAQARVTHDEAEEEIPLTGGEAAAGNTPPPLVNFTAAGRERLDVPAEDDVSAENAVLPRLTVYTAKYRLTLKGPDRGKWEFALQAEADAPLLTVDKVVRGVQQRSGDAEEPVRLSGDEFRALLPLTP